MNHGEYKAMYAAKKYFEGLEKKRERNMEWFLTQFLPSVASKIGRNPDYPDSCIVSEKQADILHFYMDSNDKWDDYKVGNDGMMYFLEYRGNWPVLVRSL